MNYQDGLDRMPHSGAMRLIERVVEATETTIHCVARDHTQPEYPLRLNGTVFVVNLVELGAQAAAVHTSLYNIASNHTGLLVGLRNIDIAQQTLDGTSQPLEIAAEQLQFGGETAIYGFSVQCNDRGILTGQAILKMKVENT